MLKHHKSMFQVPRNRKFYKERKDNTITREDDVKLFHFRKKSVQWIADFLGNDDEETRGGALSSVMKIKIIVAILSRYIIMQGLPELADQNNTVNSSSSGNNRKNVQKNRS
jgi:hypothetical protein